jgi:hypothetical protein
MNYGRGLAHVKIKFITDVPVDTFACVMERKNEEVERKLSKHTHTPTK